MKNDPLTPISPAELLLELKVLVGEAETMMAESLSGHSARDFDGLRERCSAVQHRFNAACASAGRKIAAGVKCADDTIRANPYQAVAIGAGAALVLGAVVGVAIARRRASLGAGAKGPKGPRD